MQSSARLCNLKFDILSINFNFSPWKLFLFTQPNLSSSRFLRDSFTWSERTSEWVSEKKLEMSEWTSERTSKYASERERMKERTTERATKRTNERTNGRGLTETRRSRQGGKTLKRRRKLLFSKKIFTKNLPFYSKIKTVIFVLT